MRIDIAKNLKAIIQQEKRRSTRRWVIFFGLIAVICYSFVLLSTYVLKRNAGDASSPTTVNKYEQSIIRVDAHVAAQTLHYRPTKAVLYRSSNYTPSGLIRHEVATNPLANKVATPNATVGAQAVKVHTTSSATVHNVGSGAGGGKAAIATSTQSSAVPFSTSTSSLVMPTAVWTSSRALSVQNTRQSEQQLIAANSAEAPSHHGNIRRWGGTQEHDDEPFLDPIGDGLGVLLLAAVIYAAVALIKRKHLITHK